MPKSPRITNETYIQALAKLHDDYSHLPWYQRWTVRITDRQLFSALSAIDQKNPTVAQANTLLKASEDSWFFKYLFGKPIFGVLDNFKQAVQSVGFLVESPTIIKNLPTELMQIIGSKLTSQDLLDLTGSSQAHAKLFKPMHEKSKLLDRFMQQVILGNYTVVQAMLEKDIKLLTQTAEIKDKSTRTFKSISGFEYALWALDQKMWTIMLSCIPKNKLGEDIKKLLLTQYQEIKAKGATYIVHSPYNDRKKTITETHFNYNERLDAIAAKKATQHNHLVLMSRGRLVVRRDFPNVYKHQESVPLFAIKEDRGNSQSYMSDPELITHERSLVAQKKDSFDKLASLLASQQEDDPLSAPVLM